MKYSKRNVTEEELKLLEEIEKIEEIVGKIDSFTYKKNYKKIKEELFNARCELLRLKEEGQNYNLLGKQGNNLEEMQNQNEKLIGKFKPYNEAEKLKEYSQIYRINEDDEIISFQEWRTNVEVEKFLNGRVISQVSCQRLVLKF